MEQRTFLNYAFISYSHADEKWAKWVQRKLESYRFPSALRKKNSSLPKNISPVFRDQTDLAGTVLETSLQKQLEDSENLIVICSPNSAQSVYVEQEVAYFRSLGREQNIIPFIVDGTPHAVDPTQECFCPALVQGGELLGASVKELGSRKALLRVIASMMHLRFDALLRREQVRRRKRIAISTTAAVLAMAAFAVSLKLIVSPERSAHFAQQAMAALEKKSIYEAVENGEQSVKNLLLKEEGSDGIVALRSALTEKDLNLTDKNHHEVFRIDTSGRELIWFGNSPDDSKIYLCDGPHVEIYDNKTGILLERNRLEDNPEYEEELAALFHWERDEDGGYIMFTSWNTPENNQDEGKYKVVLQDGDLFLWNGNKSKKYENVYGSLADTWNPYCFNRDETVFAYYNSNTESVVVENLNTGLQRQLSTKGCTVFDLQLSRKGALLGLSYRTGDEPDGEQRYQVYDLNSNVTLAIYDLSPAGDEVMLSNTLENYYYVQDNGLFMKFCFEDQEPLTSKEQVFERFKKEELPFVWNGAFQLSNDGATAHSMMYISDDTNSFYIHDFFDVKTGVLLWRTWSSFGVFEVDFDENMTLAVTNNGEFVDIRSGKVFYNDEGLEGLFGDHVAVNKSGTKAIGIDCLNDVYCYSIDGKNVKKKRIFTIGEKPESLETLMICFCGISDHYIVMTTEDVLYCYCLDDGTLNKETTGVGKLTNQGAPTSSFEKDGLFFFTSYDGGIFIYDPQQKRFLEDETDFADDLAIGLGNPFLSSYTEKTHLFCFSELTGQMQYSTEYVVFENKGRHFEKLYSVRMSTQAISQFSSDGKYLIMNVVNEMNKSCKAIVLDAFTGQKLMELPDRLISIIDGVIYDINAPYVPSSLPTAHFYTAKELAKIAWE